MSARRTNVAITKYILLGLIVVTFAESVFLIIHSIKNYKQLSVEEDDDYYTKDKGEGYYAKGWMISAVAVLALTDLVSLVSAWGIYRGMSTVSMLYGIYCSLVATYMAYDKYLSRTYVAFVLPQIIGIVAILYAVINYLYKNDNPIQMDAVMELSKRTVAYEPVKNPLRNDANEPVKVMVTDDDEEE